MHPIFDIAFGIVLGFVILAFICWIIAMIMVPRSKRPCQGNCVLRKKGENKWNEDYN